MNRLQVWVGLESFSVVELWWESGIECFTNGFKTSCIHIIIYLNRLPTFDQPTIHIKVGIQLMFLRLLDNITNFFYIKCSRMIAQISFQVIIISFGPIIIRIWNALGKLCNRLVVLILNFERLNFWQNFTRLKSYCRDEIQCR